ncbi:triple tyrosine motif-containing protein [Chitinophaga barathri]|uniref:Transcriptional regulator n=1 Tax=Chitinophaga barathri TaxID=1647451 RepID=A0A3N4MCC2_9BACT|nr:triple tyrosine motif-containing protein [Chitinophaga barathri]RPD41542.1 transcriptional regulator [Chitinophaga barathri]
MRTLVLLLTLFSLPARSQNTLGTPFVVNYHKALFNGGSRTWDIKQDNKGIMYFANDEGLVTFNGSFWKLFPLPNKTVLRSVYIGPNDRIYAGGQDEIGYFEAGGHNTLHYTSLKKLIPRQYQDFADVWNTIVHEKSVFFRVSDRIFKLDNNRIAVFKPAREWSFLGKAGNRLFAQDAGSGLLEYKNDRWMPLVNGSLLQDLTVTAVFPSGKENYRIETLNNVSFWLHQDSVVSIQGIPQEYIYTPSFARLSDSAFVTATALEGCLVRDACHRLIQRISVAEGLQNNNATAVFVDRDQNIWAGVDNAIAFINYSSPIRFLRPDRVNDVIGYSTLIYNDHLYLSTSNGVYAAPLAGSGGDLSSQKSLFSLIKGSDRGEAWQLEEINGQLLSTHNTGTFVIRGREAFPISQGMGSWKFLPLTSVYPIQNILVGGYWGIDLLHFREGRFENAGRLKGTSDSYRFLTIDENGDIWSSHPYRGIYRLQVSPDSLRYTARFFSAASGLPSAFNNYVFKIKNRVVFPTESGVYEFDAAAGRFIPSDFLSVFAGMALRYMKEDPEGNIWFCSGRKVGLARFSAMDTSKSPYSLTFFPELEAHMLSKFDNIYPYNPENIFIGSEKGAIHINYKKYVSQERALTIFLNEAKAIGKKDSLLSGGFFYRNAQGGYSQQQDEIHSLPPGFNAFHFEYSVPAYGFTNDIEYSYRLEGYEKEWSSWSSKTAKDYTNLPDGRYTFRVKARDNLHNASEELAYAFTIHPPWYKTTWAMLAYLALTILAVYLLGAWHKQILQRQQKKFDEKKKQLEYIHQLEREKNEKEIIQLQNEKLAGEVALKNKELASATMQLAGNTDTLSKLKDQVFKLNHSAGGETEMKKLISLVKGAEESNANWDKFAEHFDEVNNDLLGKLKKEFPDLSRSDLKMCAYLRLNFSSKQISQLHNISVRGVEIHRYRIRKKLGLKTGQSLSTFLGNL